MEELPKVINPAGGVPVRTVQGDFVIPGVPAFPYWAGELPEAQFHLNYPREIAEECLGMITGPNRLEEWLTIVAIEPRTDGKPGSRVGLAWGIHVSMVAKDPVVG